MIAINLNNKTIRIKHVVTADYIDERNTYLELSDFWIKSPYIPCEPPFGFDMEHSCIFMAVGWKLHETNIYGEVVRTLI